MRAATKEAEPQLLRPRLNGIVSHHVLFRLLDRGRQLQAEFLRVERERRIRSLGVSFMTSRRLSSADRIKHLAEQADTKLPAEAEKQVKAAAKVDDLLAALGKRIDPKATPSPVAKGSLVLQPNDERRRSSSHYTPRSFTEPIVRKTLEPVLARLVGPDLATVPADKSPTPAQILDLMVGKRRSTSRG